MKYNNISIPEPGLRQVVVKHEAIGLNFIDIMQKVENIL